MTQTSLSFEQQTRADQLEKAWREFHESNGRVWVYFQKFCFELINRGRKHCSADMICHRIRYEMAGEVITKDPVRINNNHVRFYADLFAATYPQHGTFFTQRRRTSEDKPPCEPDVQVHDLPRKPNAAADYRMAEVAHLNSRGFSR